MPSSLCLACRQVTVEALTTELDCPPQWWEDVADVKYPCGMMHLESAKSLPESARSCSLCQLILEAVTASISAKNIARDGPSNLSTTRKSDVPASILNLEEQLIEEPIYLRPKRNSQTRLFPENEVVDPWCIRAFVAFVPTEDSILTGMVRLFAHTGSEASQSGDIVGRPRLTSSDCDGAFLLLQSWYSSCMKMHPRCLETISSLRLDAYPNDEEKFEEGLCELPTRVIDVSPDPLCEDVRLIESKGLVAPWVALSHCWGPVDKRPITTLTQNKEQYKSRIPWEKIPKTFQDAIKITRSLGFRYLWIDSLCIIQDDREDWLRESKMMGQIYERARLTIAASHAPDSSVGCFIPRAPSPPVVELAHVGSEPSESPDTTSAGFIYATAMPQDYAPISPEFGILNERGWATQEWLLSRRVIFYTDGCIAWSCTQVTQRETGEVFHTTSRNRRWKYIVEKYSARKLSNPKDRLIALEGLKSEFEKRTKDLYIHGIWRGNPIPDQALWFGIKKLDRALNPLDVPTYTWASTMSPVHFLMTDVAVPSCKFIDLEEPKTLILQGTLVHGYSFHPLNDAATTEDFHVSSHSESDCDDHEPCDCIRLSFREDTRQSLSDDMGFYINNDKGRAIGWAVLDELTLPYDMPVECFILMTSQRKEKRLGKLRYRRVDRLLLLQKPKMNSEVYHRIGIGRVEQTVRKPLRKADNLRQQVMIE